MTFEQLSRRTVFQGVAAVGAGAALSACGTARDSTAAPVDPNSMPDVKAGTTLGKAADIPVGSGKIFPDQKIVVTQQAAGEFKAFSAVCTHQGCIVSTISPKEIVCACHGSAFSLTDGSVLAGPAPKPLPPVKIADENGTITAL